LYEEELNGPLIFSLIAANFSTTHHLTTLQIKNPQLNNPTIQLQHRKNACCNVI
jgi:hypothetical protein